VFRENQSLDSDKRNFFTAPNVPGAPLGTVAIFQC
jgi:hypothetical protein